MQAFFTFGYIVLQFIVAFMDLDARLTPKEATRPPLVARNMPETRPSADAGTAYVVTPRAVDAGLDSSIIQRPYEAQHAFNTGFDQWPIVHNAERSLKNPNAGSACHALQDYWNIMVPAGQMRRDELVVQRMRVLEPQLRRLCPYLKPRTEVGVDA